AALTPVGKERRAVSDGTPGLGQYADLESLRRRTAVDPVELGIPGEPFAGRDGEEEGGESRVGAQRTVVDAVDRERAFECRRHTGQEIEPITPSGEHGRGDRSGGGGG